MSGLLIVAAARCTSTGPAQSLPDRTATLRIATGQTQLRTIVRNLTLEGLTKVEEDGVVKSRAAEKWVVSSDGLTVDILLRAGVKFHDGSDFTAGTVAEVLRRVLPQEMGPASEDVASIEAVEPHKVRVRLKMPSPLLLEALEVQIEKPNGTGIGTGPFAASGSAEAPEMVANLNYYQTPPSIGRVVFVPTPSLRYAWAEMLRDNADMVYELSGDALEVIQTASTINVFSYTRHYQYVLLLNRQSTALQPASVRRALNAAIDRHGLIRDGMNGHGTPSAGPVWPRHWAIHGSQAGFDFNPDLVARELGRAQLPSGGERPPATVRFTCVTSAEFERLALVLQRQFEASGIEMTVNVLTNNELVSLQRGQEVESLKGRGFDALLADAISGPSIVRSYLWWHSKSDRNRLWLSSPLIDATLDRVQHATSNEAYRSGVVAFQEAMVQDPLAVFLTWSDRARVVSSRFEVPSEQGVDILGSLRLWRPANTVQDTN